MYDFSNTFAGIGDAVASLMVLVLCVAITIYHLWSLASLDEAGSFQPISAEHIPQPATPTPAPAPAPVPTTPPALVTDEEPTTNLSPPPVEFVHFSGRNFLEACGCQPALHTPPKAIPAGRGDTFLDEKSELGVGNKRVYRYGGYRWEAGSEEPRAEVGVEADKEAPCMGLASAESNVGAIPTEDTLTSVNSAEANVDAKLPEDTFTKLASAKTDVSAKPPEDTSTTATITTITTIPAAPPPTISPQILFNVCCQELANESGTLAYHVNLITNPNIALHEFIELREKLHEVIISVGDTLVQYRPQGLTPAEARLFHWHPIIEHLCMHLQPHGHELFTSPDPKMWVFVRDLYTFARFLGLNPPEPDMTPPPPPPPPQPEPEPVLVPALVSAPVPVPAPLQAPALVPAPLQAPTSEPTPLQAPASAPVPEPYISPLKQEANLAVITPNDISSMVPSLPQDVPQDLSHTAVLPQSQTITHIGSSVIQTNLPTSQTLSQPSQISKLPEITFGPVDSQNAHFVPQSSRSTRTRHAAGGQKGDRKLITRTLPFKYPPFSIQVANRKNTQMAIPILTTLHTQEFRNQDWNLSDKQLLGLSKEAWCWNDDHLWSYSCILDFDWDPEDSAEAERAACKNIRVVEKRLKDLVIPLKRAAVVLRLQAYSTGPNVTSPPLLGELKAAMKNIDDMMKILCEGSENTDIAIQNGNWTEWQNACLLLNNEIVAKHGAAKGLREGYGKPAWEDFKTQWDTTTGWWLSND